VGINKHYRKFPAKIGGIALILVKIMLFLGYFRSLTEVKGGKIQGIQALYKRIKSDSLLTSAILPLQSNPK
jgi:hypothetical protein